MKNDRSHSRPGSRSGLRSGSSRPDAGRERPVGPSRSRSSFGSSSRSAPPAPLRDAPPLPLLEPLQPPPDFLAAASQLSIEFEAGELEKMGLHLALLLAANQTTNLTAITDPNQAWHRHTLDSLTLLPFLADLADGSSVIDVGSGGGFPGIPLAISIPRLRFTLLEATGKKAEFLRTVVKRLALSNVAVLNQRAEGAAQDRGERTGTGRVGGHREKYDAVVARAVGRLRVLAELTVPFAKVGGRVVLIKGQQAGEELAEAEGALHLLKAVHVSTTPTPTGRVVLLEKGSATPRDYPRADGEPSRAPLGGKR